jgi:DNA repair protein RadC
VTRQLRDASKAVDIDLLDHVIVGRKEIDPAGLGFYSFRESGLL